MSLYFAFHVKKIMPPITDDVPSLRFLTHIFLKRLISTTKQIKKQKHTVFCASWQFLQLRS